MIAALVVAAIAAVTDARTGRIPDTLTLVALGLGLGRAAAHGLVAVGIACTWVALALAACTLLRGLGGGDTKMMMALAALMGAPALAAGVFAFVLLRFLPLKIERRVGPPIFVGVLVVTALELLC